MGLTAMLWSIHQDRDFTAMQDKEKTPRELEYDKIYKELCDKSNMLFDLERFGFGYAYSHYPNEDLRTLLETMKTASKDEMRSVAYFANRDFLRHIHNKANFIAEDTKPLPKPKRPQLIL